MIYEFGSRCLRAGFAGESAPRCILQFGPEHNRRVGDFERWTSGFDEKGRRDKGAWAEEWELWRMDARELDMRLLEDKIERAIRDIHSNIFLMDTKSRKSVLALPPCLPHPLIEAILRTLFTGPHQPPSVYVVGNPLLCTVAAGLRSALVVDIGWHETTVTALCEYREVLQRRTDRAAKMLSQSTAEMLEEALPDKTPKLSFAAVEDIVTRMSWCQTATHNQASNDAICIIPMPNSINDVELPFAKLAASAEKTFFDKGSAPEQIDDDHQPLHTLVWKCLLALPFDVRAICISRIIITGGPSKMPGLKTRLLKEIEALVSNRGWDPVISYGSAAKAREKTLNDRHANLSVRVKPPETSDHKQDELKPIEDGPVPPSQIEQERDEVMEKLNRDVSRRDAIIKGVVRGVETLGAWAGASLMASLRVEGSIEIKRDEFLKYGLANAGSAI